MAGFGLDIGPEGPNLVPFFRRGMGALGQVPARHGAQFV